MKLHTKSDSVQTDFVTPKRRLTKSKPHADFDLADNDDFFGFNASEGKMTTYETILYTLISVFFVYFVLSAIAFIFNG